MITIIEILQSVLNWFRSDTFKTIALLFFVNGFQAIVGYIPSEYMPLINVIGAVVAGYFRVNIKTQL
jgi:hypothetical protein